MSKAQTTEKQEGLILLNDHKDLADKLINKLNGQVIPSIQYLGSVFDSLELGEMTNLIFHDLIENAGIETSKRFREKVLEDLADIPSKKLKEIASAGSEQELQAVINLATKLKQDYSKYFKYVSFNKGEFIISDSAIEEIYNNHKEYESKQASLLREKHIAALDALNDFFALLKTLDPGYIITPTSLIAAFDSNDSESKSEKPFNLREVSYQAIAERAQKYEQNLIDRAVFDFVYSLERQYNNEGPHKVHSTIQRIKKEGTPDEISIVNSKGVSDFIHQMNKREGEKHMPKTPRTINVNM